MLKILITGASGFLGSNLVKKLKNKYELLNWYHHQSLPAENIQKIDLSNTSIIQSKLDKIRPEIIIHTAAISKPAMCANNPVKAELVNVTASGEIAQWCLQNSARLIFTSTDMVYSGHKSQYTEDDNLDPLNKYGATKAEAENIITEICKNFTILRLALMYGRGAFDREYSSEWLERDLEKQQHDVSSEKIGLYSDQYRNMISVKNVADVIAEMISSEFTGVLNIGGPDSISRYDFGKLLAKKLNYSENLIKPVKFSKIDSEIDSPLNVTLNIKKAQYCLDVELLSVNQGLDLEY